MCTLKYVDDSSHITCFYYNCPPPTQEHKEMYRGGCLYFDCGDGIIVQKPMSKFIKMHTLNMCNFVYKVCPNKALKRVIKKEK